MFSDSTHSRSLRGGSDSDRTQVQPLEAVAVSEQLSLPEHVGQDPDAPRIEGYALTEKIGEGAYGQVWRAWQLRTRKEVAVKVFTQRTGLDWIFLQREVERLTRLDRHPNIVTLLDTGLDHDPPFYVMELIDGGSLQKWVNPASTSRTPQALRWMSQICDALGYVHGKGLIHCDLKPANILVDGRDQIRVVDFGQSRVFTESAASMGTLFYMAPEQAMLSSPGQPAQPDVRWDVYALGASLHAVLTGKAPYASPENIEKLETAPTLIERLERYRRIIAEDPPPRWNDPGGNPIDEEVSAVLDKCMAKDAAKRYSALAEVESDLRALAERRPVTPLSSSRSYRAKKFILRNPVGIGLAIAVIAAAGFAGYNAIQRAQLVRVQARDMLASFVTDPIQAARNARIAQGALAAELRALTSRYVESPAFTERVMGARAGLFVAADAFWRSVDAGRLGEHGEWLEVPLAFASRKGTEAESGVRDSLLAAIESKLTSGTDREKHTAFCLWGKLATPGSGAREPALNAVATERNPGVIAAADWTLRQLGANPTYKSTDRVFVDDMTQLVFVRIPSIESFQRGSPADEPDRFEDEYSPTKGVGIPALYVASTELTLASVRPFFETSADRLDADVLIPLRNLAESVPARDQSQIAAGYFSQRVAQTLCAFLNEKGASLTPVRRYRLPTEDEWEYAARGGNHHAYCYGGNPAYAPFFAHCNGSGKPFHVVAQHMPNAFGLFDVHGGVWEMTSSLYAASPTDPPSLTDFFVYRGGAWNTTAVRCRSAQRNYGNLTGVSEYIGARLILEFDP